LYREIWNNNVFYFTVREEISNVFICFFWSQKNQISRQS